ncbi:hypothetical protein EDB87DRAFT_1146186 [Lactarius vividus]|nr:hypothetical protein EDB87DRAFT_1146186 [Lactarius vividus]
MHKSHRRTHIVSSDHSISISLIRPGAPVACLKLQLFCEPLKEQLLFVTRICVDLSASLFNVQDLCISTTGQSGRGDGAYNGWRDLLNSFTSVQRFHVTGNISTDIVRALQLPDRQYENMLPSLHKLYISRPEQRHAPLGEVIVSFMISRQLSGRHIAVEYERICNINELRGTEPLSQQATIEMLSDDILLNIFRYYLDAAPQTWPTLTYVCQRWRQIVHTSPLGLNLRLYFTPGTPVLNALDCWTALPIIVQYGGFPNLDPPAPEDDNNIIVALKRSGRVSSISLTITDSLLHKLSAISEPFLELEELVLLSRDNAQLTLSSTFRWGRRLRTLHLTRIVFPSMLQLLSLSHDLVYIQLHEIPSAGYFSPEAFANALSRMTSLRTLSLHFLSLPPRRNYLALPPASGERVVLPALTSLKYRGTSKYLDSLVARINAPRLGDLDITFFSQPTIDASELGRFIERTEMQMSLIKAEIQISHHAISILFTHPSPSTRLRLQISCKQLNWQLSSMAQVCDQFSLLHVETLGINTTQSPSEQDDVDGEQWLELVRSFGGATDFRVAGVRAMDILCALRLADGEHVTDVIVLTAMRNIRVQASDTPLFDAARIFTTSRQRSGRPVQMELSCTICGDNFEYPVSLRRHLVDQHAYRLMCSYCDDFEFTPKHRDHLVFREHLKSKHPQVARNNSRILDPFFIGLVFLVDQHSSLRAPESHPPR